VTFACVKLKRSTALDGLKHMFVCQTKRFEYIEANSKEFEHQLNEFNSRNERCTRRIFLHNLEAAKFCRQ